MWNNLSLSGLSSPLSLPPPVGASSDDDDKYGRKPPAPGPSAAAMTPPVSAWGGLLGGAASGMAGLSTQISSASMVGTSADGKQAKDDGSGWMSSLSTNLNSVSLNSVNLNSALTAFSLDTMEGNNRGKGEDDAAGRSSAVQSGDDALRRRGSPMNGVALWSLGSLSGGSKAVAETSTEKPPLGLKPSSPVGAPDLEPSEDEEKDDVENEWTEESNGDGWDDIESDVTTTMTQPGGKHVNEVKGKGDPDVDADDSIGVGEDVCASAKTMQPIDDERGENMNGNGDAAGGWDEDYIDNDTVDDVDNGDDYNESPGGTLKAIPDAAVFGGVNPVFSIDDNEAENGLVGPVAVPLLSISKVYVIDTEESKEEEDCDCKEEDKEEKDGEGYCTEQEIETSTELRAEGEEKTEIGASVGSDLGSVEKVVKKRSHDFQEPVVEMISSPFESASTSIEGGEEVGPAGAAAPDLPAAEEKNSKREEEGLDDVKEDIVRTDARVEVPCVEKKGGDNVHNNAEINMIEGPLKEETIEDVSQTLPIPDERPVEINNIKKEATESTTRLENEIKSHRKTESDLHNEIKKLKQGNRNSQRERTQEVELHLKKFSDLKRKFQSEICDREHKNREVEESFASSRRRESELTSLLKISQEKVSQLSDEMDTKKSDNRNLIGEVQKVKDEVGKLEEKNCYLASNHSQEKHSLQNEASRLSLECSNLKSDVKASKTDLEQMKVQYESLKNRAKEIAMELRERRNECKDLQQSTARTVAECESLKNSNMDLRLSKERSELELVEVKASKKLIQERLKESKAKCSLDDRKDKQSLESYKKKAQAALASANGRVSTAEQARQVAEQQAQQAHKKLSELLSTTNEESSKYEDMKSSIEEMVMKLSEAKDRESSLMDDNKNLQDIMVEKEQLESNLETSKSETDTYRRTFDKLKKELSEQNTKMLQMRQEISSKDSKLYQCIQREKDLSLQINKTNVDHVGTEEIEALQQELIDANDTISALKESLRGAGSIWNDHVSTRAPEDPSGTGPDSGTVPSLYVMTEKQLELEATRDEISRLASLLSEKECDRQEALDYADELKRTLDEVESRARRQEKMAGGRSSVVRGAETGSSMVGMTKETDSSGADVNIEYLKNVMLRYLKAEDEDARRALVPAIAAVLCFTSDEVSEVSSSLDSQSSTLGTGGLSGFLSYYALSSPLR